MVMIAIFICVGGWMANQSIKAKQQWILQQLQGTASFSTKYPQNELGALGFNSREYVKIINLNPH